MAQMQLSLSQKFLVALSAVLIVVVPSLIGVQVLGRKADLEMELDTRGSDAAELLAAAAVQPILNYDAQTLDILVERIVQDPTVAAARIANNDDGISASAESDSLGRLRDFEAVVVGDEGIVLGSVALTIDTAPYEARLHGGVMTTVVSLAVTAILLLGLITLLLRRIVIKPLQAAVSRLARISGGDLSAAIPRGGRDEVGQLLSAMGVTVTNFREHVAQVSGSAGRLAEAAAQMRVIAQDGSHAVQRQQDATDQIATAINQMSTTVQDVARNAAETADASKRASDESQHGREVVANAAASIGALAEELNATAKNIVDLEAHTASIGTVLDVINGVAEQTNLLALNAAIEAARAGEQGRGFAVVAEEVRTLATRTGQSTQEIQAMIESLQRGARSAVDAMHAGNDKAEQTVRDAAQAGEALQVIIEHVTEIADRTAQIACAAEQQGVVAEDINRNVVNISQEANATAEGAQRTAETGEGLVRLVEDLRALVSRFRT